MRKKKLSLILFCLFIFSTVLAQHEKTKTVTVSGSYVASKYESRDYGEKQALLEAKKNALKKAGIPEHIISTGILGIDNTSIEYQVINSEMSILELEGCLRNVELIETNSEFVDDQLTQYSVTIRAEVIVEEMEDYLFDFETAGFQTTYFSGEKMTFTIKPTKDCYLRIFYFGTNDSENAQIYPMENIFKEGVRFKADVPVQFPPKERQYLYGRAFKYTMTISDPNNNIESGWILIVALKNNYPFARKNKDKALTKQEVFSWLSNIKKNEKRVQLQVVHICKR